MRRTPAKLVRALLDRPFTLWAGYVFALLTIAVVAKTVWPSFISGAAGLNATQVGVQALVTLLPLPFAAAIGWRRIGFVTPRHWHLALFPLATVGFGYLGQFRAQPVTTIALAVVLVVLVAVGEEIAFRGVLLELLSSRGTGYAVTATSALFGATHLVNLALGAAVPGVILQVLFSGMGAAGFAALRLRTASLWIPIGLHAAYDLIFRVVVIQPGTAFANTVYTLHGFGWLLFAVVLLAPRVQRRVAIPQE